MLGLLSMVTSGVIATFQHDVKKIIACSTASQLGYMTFSACSGNLFETQFHLTSHAFFKALLFLTAGCLIHGNSEQQDTRKAGKFAKFFPVIFSCFLVGNLSISGFPETSGFISKEKILEATGSVYQINALVP